MAKKKPSPRNWHTASEVDRDEIRKRLAPYQFKKGQIGNPKGSLPGWRPAHIQLREALQEQKRLGYDFVGDAVRQAKRNPVMMKALLDKLIANKIQIGLGPDDLTDILNSVVEIITKHVKDHKIREAIAVELEALEFDE